jgi:hypothetical protein
MSTNTKLAIAATIIALALIVILGSSVRAQPEMISPSVTRCS